jgi:hypothetical protein
MPLDSLDELKVHRPYHSLLPSPSQIQVFALFAWTFEQAMSIFHQGTPRSWLLKKSSQPLATRIDLDSRTSCLDKNRLVSTI